MTTPTTNTTPAPDTAGRIDPAPTPLEDARALATALEAADALNMARAALDKAQHDYAQAQARWNALAQASADAYQRVKAARA